MKPLQRVFSKHATPLLASMVALGSCYILIKPNNTHNGIVTFILCKSVIHDFGPKICNLCRECSRNRQLHFWRAWWHGSCGISSLNQITLIFEIVIVILCKSVIHDFGPKICNLCRECSRNRQLHFGRAWCRWSCGISSLNQITLIFGIVIFILYKSVIHDFGPKYM